MHPPKMNIREILAKNLGRLREVTPSLSSPKQIVKAGAASNGTIGRIAKRETGISIDKLEQLSEAYGVAVWQILHPEMQATQSVSGKPVISGLPDWPFEFLTPHQYSQISKDYKERVENELAGEWMRTQAGNGTTDG